MPLRSGAREPDLTKRWAVRGPERSLCAPATDEDLTQTTFGISRDDAETSFLSEYLTQGILPENPFDHLDEGGVGTLMQIAVELGRKTRPGLDVGICGEHGGDPKSIAFCHRLGLDYVSCSPFRLPVARLAAAHAALRERKARPVGKSRPALICRELP